MEVGISPKNNEDKIRQHELTEILCFFCPGMSSKDIYFSQKIISGSRIIYEEIIKDEFS